MVKKLLISAVLLLSVSMFSFSLEIATDEWEPYQFNVNGKMTGFSYDVVTTVFSKMKISPVNIKFYPWERALKMLKDGESDAILNAVFSDERAVYGNYSSESFVDTSWVCWARTDSGLTIKKMEDLKGKKVGVVAGYFYETAFMDYIKANCTVEPVNDDLTNFQKLNGKRLDLIVSDFLNGSYLLKQNPNITGIVCQPYVVKKVSLYILFNKNRVKKDIVDQFSKVLADFKKTAEYKAIFDKYFK